MKRRHVIGLVALVAAAALFSRVAATYRPILQYAPYGPSAPAPVRYAAEAVQESLVRAGRLPTFGATLELGQDGLEWENVSEAAPAGAEVRVRAVRVSNWAPFLRSLLDDDPICVAEVETRVTTADGQQATLTVDLWDYGLVTPWSIYPTGDGWKPSRWTADGAS